MRKVNHAGRNARLVLRVLPLLPWAIGVALADRQSTPASPETSDLPLYSTAVSMVILPVTVLDARGGFVTGLQEPAFQVFESGVRQRVSLFQHEDVPVSVGLIVDSSGSMRRKRKDVIDAAREFVRRSNPEDEMFVVNFSDRLMLGLPDTKLFSADLGELGRAVSGMTGGGKTALYDAISLGLTHLHQATRSKKIVLVISDGGDNASMRGLTATVEAAKEANVAIYTLGLFDEYDKDRNIQVLKRLARITGGEAFFPDRPEAAAKACKRIAAEIRNQYTIGYVPADSRFDGAYRRIEVKMTGPRQGRLRVRTRAGYVASPDWWSAPKDGDK